jgi:hypothetical protein
MMPKIIEAADGTLMFFCPGCGEHHGINRTWQFNEDFENPTISPSIRVSTLDKPEHASRTICHSFVREGKIQFLSDCVHSLAGQTVDLPDIDSI